MTHPSREDLTAYALGALDSGEERTVAEHTTGCERCTGELRHLAPAVGVLAESVEQHQPPPEMRERVMATVRSEAASAGEASRVRHARRPESRFDLRGLLMRPAAGFAAVALVVAAVGGYLIAGEDDGGSETTTIAVESAAPGMGGSLEIESDAATLKVHGMPALEKGAVYQVWVADGAVARPSATFVPHEDGTATAAVPEVLGGGEAVMVTEEPRPGRSMPTLPSILDVSIN